MSAIYWVKSIRAFLATTGFLLLLVWTLPVAASGVGPTRLALPEPPLMLGIEDVARELRGSVASSSTALQARGIDLNSPRYRGLDPELSHSHTQGWRPIEVKRAPGADSQRAPESATESWFCQVNLESVLWAACAATLVLASAWMLRRLLKASSLNWSYAGAASTAIATAFFVACGSNHDVPLSPTQRHRAESVEITGVPAGTEFYLPDAQLTPQVVTKADGAVRSRSVHHAYGQVRAQSGEHTDPFGYVGNEEDRGSGLSHFGARPYRPELGLFYAPDPIAVFEPEKTIGNPSRLQPYAYAGGDPINQSDPSGLTFAEFVGGIGVQLGDMAKSAAQAVVEQAKSDFAMVAEGRIATFAKTVIIDRSPLTGMAHGAVASVENVANFADDFRKAVDAPSDFETGRLAVRPMLTAMSVAATAMGAASAGKFLTGRGLRPKVPGGGSATCVGGKCGGPGVCFVAGTPIASGGGFVPIEQLRLGDRVDAPNPSCVSDRWPESALTISLEMPNPEAPEDILYIELVRPAEWLKTVGVEAEGQSTWLDLKEMGIAGTATVTAISAPPKLSSGSGCLVLMTVRHVATELLRITFTNGTEPLVLTPGHRLLVEARGWTEARDLVDGTPLWSDSGPAYVKSIEYAEPGQAVYNVEVAREHTYRVSTSRIFAHNQCGDGAGAGVQPTIHPGQQGKHVPGHNNFKPGRSELTHPDPQALLDRGIGTGVRHGTKEVVDFGEEIGTHVARDGTRSTTSRGTIHYNSKNEAHIVPALPEPPK
ncbi:MAG TPA: polymorphic toxin type 50 domain-containing protein [Polyangiaceae bacterium]|nr:polymorphic toxin type 50 domain-containing protein [Polyangiaceae bacterium]